MAYHFLIEDLPCLHKPVQKMGMAIKPLPELFGHCEDKMAISHPGKEGSTDIIYPLIHIYLCTGETETALTTKGNLLQFTTPKTPIGHKSILWVTTSQHFVNHIITILCVVSWILLAKLIPVTYKYLLKYILVMIRVHANIIPNLNPKDNNFLD